MFLDCDICIKVSTSGWLQMEEVTLHLAMHVFLLPQSSGCFSSSCACYWSWSSVLHGGQIARQGQGIICQHLNKCLAVELPIGFLMSGFLLKCLSKLGLLRMHLLFPMALKMGTWAVNTEVKHSLTSLTCYDHSLSHKSQEKLSVRY